MRIKIQLFFLLLMLVLFTPSVIFAKFYALKDTSYWGNDFFKTDITDAHGDKYIIVRRVLEKPKYDGPPGKTAITITKDGSIIFNNEIKGQYHFFGFEPETAGLYTYYEGQHGAEYRILSIVLFSKDQLEGKVFGPKGGFQYGSSSPDGKYCLLLDSRLIAVNLVTEKWEELNTGYDFNNMEANPMRVSKFGGNICCSVNLSGEFFEMIWSNLKSGTIVIKNANHEIIKKIQINIKDSG